MSVSLHANSRDEGLETVRYEPAYRYIYGENDGYGIGIPAKVWVRFGDGSLVLDIDDAQSLMEGLAVVLVEHAVALKDSAPKGVA